MRYVPRRTWIMPALVGVAVATAELPAQTRFEWPDSKIDVTQYKFIEDCFGAAKRVRDSVYARDNVLTDTVPLARQSFGDPLPERVIAVAKRCTDKYAATQIPLEQTFFAEELFLIAGRDADAATVIQQRLQTFKANDSVGRAYVLDSAAIKYLAATPKRMDAARPLVDQITRYGNALPFMSRIGRYWDMMQAADLAKNDSLRTYYGNSLLDLTHGLTDEQRMSKDAMFLPSIVWATIRMLHRTELLDSLRKSTAAFTALQVAQYTHAMGHPDPNMPIGKQVPVLKGDFWYPDSARRLSYPRQGKVTAVVFANSSLARSNRDLMQQSIIQRLKQRYPDIDVIFVERTRGYFGQIEPPDPHQESQYIDTLFRKFLGLPVVVTVSTTPFVRVPNPDRRRVDQPTDNETGFKALQNAENSNATNLSDKLYLVDRDGVLVSSDNIWPSSEAMLNEMVGVLMTRGKRVASQ